MTNPMDDQIDQMFADFLATPKAERRSTNRSHKRSSVKLPRPEWMPESRSVRVTPRGAPQTSWWKAARVAEATLVVRSMTSEELLAQQALANVPDRQEELTAKSYKLKPGAAEEEKKLDILQKIHNVWL